MASREHINHIAESMLDTDWRRKKLPTPTNARQAFLINTTIGGPENMCVVELKDGRVDMYCPVLNSDQDVYGFDNLRHFEDWFDVNIVGDQYLENVNPPHGPHTAIAATIGSNYIKR